MKPSKAAEQYGYRMWARITRSFGEHRFVAGLYIARAYDAGRRAEQRRKRK